MAARVTGDEKDVRMFPRRAQLRTLTTTLAVVALVGMQAGPALGGVQAGPALGGVQAGPAHGAVQPRPLGGAQPGPALDAGTSAAAVTPPPACTTADAPAPFSLYTQWASTFLDAHYRVSSSYVPPGLVSTANAGTNGGYLVRHLVIGDLGAMFRAAKRAGVTIRIAAAYRSYAQQRAAYLALVARVGATKAALQMDRPGHSEHQLGTAIDISNTHGAYSWLAANAWRYGFVISYPPGERSVSCRTSTPGHVRYVGRTRAAAIHASGLVPRAWLWSNVAAPPSFSASVNAPVVASNQDNPTYLAFTFTSTSAKRDQGLLRFVTPILQTAPNWVGGWQPALQTSKPGAAGYFRVQATTCASAGVAGFIPAPPDPHATGGYLMVQQSIDMTFDCQPGQSFVLHWFPLAITFEADPNTGALYLDPWTFLVSTRSTVTDPWTPQTGPQVTVTPTPIVLPPLPYITPPVKVTQIEQTAPAGAPPYFTIVGAGYIDVAPETTTIKGGEFYRVDTGALVTLATPDNLRISRELQVVSCIDLNAYLVNEGAGKDTPPGVLPATLDCAAIAEAARLANLPTNTFKNTDGTWLEGQISVAFSVTFVNNKLSDWDATNVECAFNGGSLSLGNAVLLWDCSLPLATSLARYNDVSADMGKIMYCPTELVRNAFSEGQRTIQCAA